MVVGRGSCVLSGWLDEQIDGACATRLASSSVRGHQPEDDSVAVCADHAEPEFLIAAYAQRETGGVHAARDGEETVTADAWLDDDPGHDLVAHAQAAALRLPLSDDGDRLHLDLLKFVSPRTTTGSRGTVPCNRPMERGLYIAASGMLAELTRQDQIANDLANATTPGYKADRAAMRAFGELVLTDRSIGRPVGALGLGTRVAEIRTDLAQGPLKETGEPLDLALEGEGFLVVRTPAGDRYTRAGQLALDAQGRLVTAGGYLVLDERGQPITLGEGTPSIAADGTISVDGRPVGRLAVVSLQSPVKQGDNLYAGTAGERPKETAVRQGWLEGSTVNPAQSMVDMIVSLRAFESLQRVIRAIDETLGRGINGAQA